MVHGVSPRAAQFRRIAVFSAIGLSLTAITMAGPVQAAQAKSAQVLTAVAALSATDVWAVGNVKVQSKHDSSFPSTDTYIQHFDGSAWSRVDSPSPGKANTLSAVTALGANDVWTVGSSSNPGPNGSQPLAEHWNGSSWTRVPVGLPKGSSGFLTSVAGTGTGDLWAVGAVYHQGRYSALAEHWDGSSWARTQIAPVKWSKTVVLEAVSAASASDVWAVGDARVGGAKQIAIQAHWDGTAWTILQTSKQGKWEEMHGLSMLSGNDGWAVGLRWVGSTTVALVEHWDGSTWTPSVLAGMSLLAISASGPDDVWAVGENVVSAGEPLIEHYDGTSWAAVDSPSDFQEFSFVSAPAPDDVWVGLNQTLLHWDGSGWE